MESEIKGESAALAAAFLWACATVLYRRLGASIFPLALNLYKGVIACFLLSMTLIWMGQEWREITLYSGRFSVFKINDSIKPAVAKASFRKA